jgi:hypothetical protein
LSRTSGVISMNAVSRLAMLSRPAARMLPEDKVC